ncbi:hypothetical protein ACIQU4_26875 [Streptomyces sp. NPDC090741]
MPARVHAGDCWEARKEVAPCPHCRPDAALEMLE